MAHDATHKDRDWCALPDGHDGPCLADWEIKHRKRLQMFKSYRGRRYIACTAAADLQSCIENLGIEDGSCLPIPDQDFMPVPAASLRAELKNTVANLLRLILILNDDQVSPDKLNSF